MNSLFNSVLETAFAFIICADIPVEELTVEVDKKYNKYFYRKDTQQMKKRSRD